MKENFNKYMNYFTNEEFWEKMKKFGKKAGTSVVYTALLLFYVLQKKDVPAKVKMTIVGALGYFILPLDLIPDAVPVAGFGDDLTALFGAIAVASFYIDSEVKELAKGKVVEWFGEDVDLSEVEEKLLKAENPEILEAEFEIIEEKDEK